MSDFLEYLTAEASKSGGSFYRITEICHGVPETVTITPANACQNSYSVAKAFTVTAIGMLWDDGLLQTDERVVDIFADLLPDGMDDAWQEMTLHHLLTHTCGFPWGYLDIDAVDPNSFGTDDYLSYLFKTKLSYKPGTDFSYSDAAFYVLSRVVSRKIGRKMDDFLWERLFYPMGFREVSWSCCPQGYPMGATGLYIYTDDMAKLGELYLRGGVYNGRRLISEAWVETAKDRGYEFHRICDGRAYGKGGAFGQMLLFMPGDDRVVAWHSYGGGDLLPAITAFKS
ncbi:MAG: beta-lactamase family protein [Ruminococcaceae bacterium]|nr:beta-lactamase family protein [Oscillospiraceae bacterium]